MSSSNINSTIQPVLFETASIFTKPLTTQPVRNLFDRTKIYNQNRIHWQYAKFPINYLVQLFNTAQLPTPSLTASNNPVEFPCWKALQIPRVAHFLNLQHKPMAVPHSRPACNKQHTS